MKTNLKKDFLEELRRIPIIHSACDKVGITRQTYYRWIGANTNFKKEVGIAMSEGTDKIDDVANSQLFKSMNNGDLRAIIYWDEKHSDRIHKRSNRLQGIVDNLSTEEVVKLATKNVLEELQIGNIENSKYILENEDPKYYSSTKARLKMERDTKLEIENSKIVSEEKIEGMMTMMKKLFTYDEEDTIKQKENKKSEEQEKIG